MKIPDQLVPIIEKVTSKIKDLDAKQRYYIFAGILVFIFAVDYFLLMNPQIKALQNISAEIKKNSENIKAAENDSKNIPHYKGEIKSIEEKITKLEQRVLSRDEESVVLERISEIASANQIKITHITPELENEKVLIANKDRKYLNFPVSIEAKSGYHNFGEFLNSIEKDNIHMRIQEFSLSSAGEARGINIKLTLGTVVYENLQNTK